MNYGWPMYRFPKRGRWAYRCGLYENSEAACCRHNVIPGPEAAWFVLACLRQRVLAPATLVKLRARLEELALAEQRADPASKRRAADEAALIVVRRKLEVVGTNIALAETPDQRAATAAVFDELKADERRLEERLRQPAAVRTGGPKEEVGLVGRGTVHPNAGLAPRGSGERGCQPRGRFERLASAMSTGPTVFLQVLPPLPLQRPRRRRRPSP